MKKKTIEKKSLLEKKIIEKKTYWRKPFFKGKTHLWKKKKTLGKQIN